MDIEQPDFYDDKVLERELREAARSEGEINLFKVIQENMRIARELRESEAVRKAVSVMWGDVADFFDQICQADTIIGLAPTDKIAIAHARMRANFDAVAAINDSFKEAAAAEDELVAGELDTIEQRDTPI